MRNCRRRDLDAGVEGSRLQAVKGHTTNPPFGGIHHVAAARIQDRTITVTGRAITVKNTIFTVTSS